MHTMVFPSFILLIDSLTMSLSIKRGTQLTICLGQTIPLSCKGCAYTLLMIFPSYFLIYTTDCQHSNVWWAKMFRHRKLTAWKENRKFQKISLGNLNLVMLYRVKAKQEYPTRNRLKKINPDLTRGWTIQVTTICACSPYVANAIAV